MKVSFSFFSGNPRSENSFFNRNAVHTSSVAHLSWGNPSGREEEEEEEEEENPFAFGPSYELKK